MLWCRRKACCGVIVVLMGFSPVFAAEENRLTLDFRAEHENNPLQLEEGSFSDTAVSVRGDIQFNKEEPVYRIDLNYDAEFRYYLEQTFDEQQFTNGRGYVDLHTKGDKLTWYVESQQQNTIINVLNPTLPINIAQRSNYGSGLRLFLPLDRTGIFLSGEASRSEVEDSTANSTAYTGILGLTHQFSRKLSTNLVGSYTQYMPDDEFTLAQGFDEFGALVPVLLPLAEEYHQKRINLAVTRRILWGEVAINGGYSVFTEKGERATDTEEKSPEYGANVILAGRFGEWVTDLSQRISTSGGGNEFDFGLEDIGNTAFTIERDRQLVVNYAPPAMTRRDRITFNYIYLETDQAALDTRRERETLGASWSHRMRGSRELTFLASQNRAREAASLITGDSESSRFEVNFRSPLTKVFDMTCGVGYEIFERNVPEDNTGVVVREKITNRRGFCSLSYDVW